MNNMNYVEVAADLVLVMQSTQLFKVKVDASLLSSQKPDVCDKHKMCK